MRAVILALVVAQPTLAAAQPAPPNSCQIRTTELNFGRYSGLDPFPTVTRAQILVDCGPAPVALRVTLTPGSSGRLLDRSMLQSTHRLHYNIYADPARRIVAGDGTGGTVALTPLLRRLGGRNRFIVFGVIPARQAIPAGDYSDQVQVVIEF